MFYVLETSVFICYCQINMSQTWVDYENTKKNDYVLMLESVIRNCLTAELSFSSYFSGYKSACIFLLYVTQLASQLGFLFAQYTDSTQCMMKSMVITSIVIRITYM